MYAYTHSLPIQHGPGDSMKDWFTSFGVQVIFQALTPIKTGSCEIPLPSPLPKGRRRKHVSGRNSALNYLTMKKLSMG